MSQSASTPVLHSHLGSQSYRFDPDARQKSWHSFVFIGIVLAGLLLRLGVVILAGNGMRTPWGGGGDTGSYVLLAQNLLAGKGYTYAGMPTALRPPGYPLLLAGFLRVFGTQAFGGVRWLQFFAGIGVAFLCAATAGRLYGEKARNAALVLALFLPTLAEMNGEILSEATATFFTALFFYFLARYVERPRWTWLAGFACSVGLGALIRFNMAVLGLVGLAVVLTQMEGAAKWRSAAGVVVLPLLVISPWLIRNEIVFHGEVLFSTHSGLDALEGVLTPEGRALPGDSDRLRTAVGWVPPGDVETNSASRLELGTEPELDAQCWRAAISIAIAKEWDIIPLAAKKIEDFWLSTDQLLWTGAFHRRERMMRAAGVVAYWGFLALAITGWFGLRVRNARMAQILLFYAALVTVMHLPFVMSTRLRMPFIDPLVAILGGIAWAGTASGISVRNGTVLTSHASA